MSRSVGAAFEMTDRTEEVYDDPSDGPALTRVTVTKRYTGVIEGSGTAHVLTAQGGGGAGYVASERVVGTLDGRSGTFVVQHAGVADGADLSAAGRIVPGSGTGELIGITGTACEASEGVLSLTYDLPD